MTSLGKIMITVSKAHLTHDVCNFFTMDPYFVAYMQEKKSYAYISKVHKKAGKYPNWNETVNFDNLGEKCFVLEVFHEKDLVGKAEIPMFEIVSRANYAGEYALYKGPKITGQIFVKVLYTSNKPINPVVAPPKTVSSHTSNNNLNELNNSVLKESVSNLDVQNKVYAQNSQIDSLKQSKQANSGIDSGVRNISPIQSGISSYPTMNSLDVKNSNEGINFTLSNSNIVMPPQMPLNNIYNNNYNQNYNQFNTSEGLKNQYYGNFQQMPLTKNPNLNPQQVYLPYNSYGNPMMNMNLINTNLNPSPMYIPQVNVLPNPNQINYHNQLPISLRNGLNEIPMQPQIINQPVLGQPIVNQPNQTQPVSFQPFPNKILPSGMSPNQFANKEINDNMFTASVGNQLVKQNSNDNSSKDKSLLEDLIYLNTLNYFKYPLFFQHNSTKIWFYDIQNASWKEMSNPCREFIGKYHRATELPDGSYFLTGGEINGQAVNTVKHFLNNYFSQKQNMITARKAHCAVFLSGFVFVFGGFTNSGVSNTCEKFDLSKGTWSNLENMNYPRGYGTGVVYGDKYIFLVGGFVGEKIDGFVENNRIERYDIIRNKFDEFNVKLPYPVYGCIATLVSNSKLFIAGGWSEENGDCAKVYTINLNNGNIDYLENFKQPGWTVLPAYYHNSNLHYFFQGEETEGLPDHYIYPLRTPKD